MLGVKKVAFAVAAFAMTVTANLALSGPAHADQWGCGQGSFCVWNGTNGNGTGEYISGMCQIKGLNATLRNVNSLWNNGSGPVYVYWTDSVGTTQSTTLPAWKQVSDVNSDGSVPFTASQVVALGTPC
ncbi:peptidase inhibitor family I36 protein [Solihabitans fulvus]|uniref:peptidase inhibitor family I36 protein n=1 Tax=Solihabitans fulvus TaxID=1892852 RepID=UPI001661D324|nr:peptidase inhibitor family I36 protein [Solihabitans fulvus]